MFTSSGRLVFESLETRIKQECGIKNIVSLCGHRLERKLFVAGITTANSASPIYEIGLDWLTDSRLDSILDTLEPSPSPTTPTRSSLVSQVFSYPLGTQKSLSSSLTSLASITSTATTLTTNSSGPTPKSSQTNGQNHSHHSNSSAGSYTALWHDQRTSKLVAAKSDKHRTVIEVFSSRTHLYEYALVESSGCEKALKKVTSLCTSEDGKLVCVDLVQNFVKFFRFV